MTEKPETKDDDEDAGDGRGCLFIIGFIILAIAIGNIHSAAAGWIVLALGLIAAAIF